MRGNIVERIKRVQLKKLTIIGDDLAITDIRQYKA